MSKATCGWCGPCVQVLIKFALFLAIFLFYVIYMLYAFSRTGTWLWEFSSILAFGSLFVVFGSLLMYFGWTCYSREHLPEDETDRGRSTTHTYYSESSQLYAPTTRGSMDGSPLPRKKVFKECCPDPCPSAFVWFLLLATVIFQIWAFLPLMLAPAIADNWEHEFYRSFNSADYPIDPRMSKLTYFSFNDFIRRDIPGSTILQDTQYFGGDIKRVVIYRDSKLLTTPACTVIFIHGSTEIGQDEGPYSYSTKRFAQYLTNINCTMAAVDYHPIFSDNGDTVRFYDAALEVSSAIQYILTDTSGVINTNRLFLMGRSRGAHIATFLAYSAVLNHLSIAPISLLGVISVYGPVNPYGDYPYNEEMMTFNEEMIGHPFIGNEELYANYSSPNLVSHGSPATLVVQGIFDRVLNYSTNAIPLVDALRDNGNFYAYLEYPVGQHAFDTLGWSAGGQITRYYIVKWISSTLLRLNE